MHGAIFCDPNFIGNFLTVDTARLQTVLEACKDNLDAFCFQEHITQERQLYDPIREVLNIIKQAVDGVPDLDNPPAFVNVSAEPVPSHRGNMTGLKPALTLFDGPIRHWETMRMPIEVKRQATYLKTGMKQLTRYARAVFAHQLHRRHVYGLAICKWDATFVRFDRSGVLYSKPMDMRNEEFRKAFAGLMMLDEVALGYDTAFTTLAGQDGRLEYYIDLPAEAFVSEGGSNIPDDIPGDIGGLANIPNASQVQTRRLKVVERLFHREGIRGRATIVVRLRKVIRPGYLNEPEAARKRVKIHSQVERKQQPTREVLDTRDYVLKLMWRDPNEQVEGQALERLVGIYGIGQHMWHGDVLKPCSLPSCELLKVGSCEGCLDMTPNRDQVLVTKNLADLDIEIPEEVEGEETEYKAVQTDEYSEAYVRQTSSVYCRLLTSTVGSPLRSAESPRQLLQAVLDAILGYWRLVNTGVLHRDISEGNVLMLQEGQGYNKREWKIPRATASELDSDLAESERLLEAVLGRLGRDPTGMLNDFDLFTTYGETGAAFLHGAPSKGDGCKAKEPELKRRKLNSGTVGPAPSSSSNKDKGTPLKPGPGRAAEVEERAGQVIDFRVGTPMFMSVRVLEVRPGHRYEHHFMDDLESFFWLIVVCIIEHVDSPGGQPTEGALKLLRKFDRHELDWIATAKIGFLGSCSRKAKLMLRALASCENSWATDPAIVSVVHKLGAYFYGIYCDCPDLVCTPTEVFPMVVEVIMSALNS